MHETQHRQSRQALAGSGAIQRLVIFTLVDEVAVAMDACGAHTRTLDNHHSSDRDQRKTERLTSRYR